MSDVIPVPCIAPDRIYKYRRAQPFSGVQGVTYMTREVKEIEGKGIFTYYHGMDVPRIGVSPTYQDFPSAMAEVDKVKIALKELLKNPFIVFRLENALRAFNRLGDKCLGQWYLEWDYWCPTAKQIYLFCGNFLSSLGVSDETCEKTAEIIATLFEYDDAYRYRLNDLMSETTKERMIAGFAKEMKRLLGLNEKREHTGDVNGKIKDIYLLARFALLIPKVKRAMMRALEAVDWKGWRLTESEIFHTLNWENYDVRGLCYEERMAQYEQIFKGRQKPRQIMITLK